MPHHFQSSSQGTSKEICGENSGQHIYYELGKDTGASATLSFTFSTATAVVVPHEVLKLR